MILEPQAHVLRGRSGETSNERARVPLRNRGGDEEPDGERGADGRRCLCRPLLWGTFVLSVLSIGGCSDSGQSLHSPGSGGKTNNLLMVTLDTTRRDFMGFHGRDPSPTPHLDRLAEECVVFEDAFTVAPLTMPAHASLMTGLYPSSHGVRDNSTFSLSEQADTLAEVLQAQGYATGAAVSAAVLDQAFGIDQGFEEFSAPRRGPNETGVHYLERIAADTIGRAQGQLAELQEPFFFWLHLFDPHYPYAPPGMPFEDEVEPLVVQRRRMYEAEIRYLDQQLGRFLDWARARPAWKRTVVLVCSDHGESLHEAGENTHGFFVSDPVMRVPLLLRHPELESRRWQPPVSLVDAMPTLLSSLGVGHSINEPLDGADLWPYLRNDRPWQQERALALESYYAYLNFGWAPFEAWVNESFRFERSRELTLYERTGHSPSRRGGVVKEATKAAWVERLDGYFDRPPRFESRSGALPARLSELTELGYVVGGGEKSSERPDFSSLDDTYSKAPVIRRISEIHAAQHAKRPEVALAMMQELCRLEPESGFFHDKYGTALLHRGPERWDEAEAHLTRALELRFQQATTCFNLGWLAMRKAELLREELVRRRGQGESGADLRSLRSAITGLDSIAIQRFRETLDRDQNYLEAMDQLARLFQSQAEVAANKSDLTTAIELYGEVANLLSRYVSLLPDHHESLAGTLEILGRCRSRRDALKHVLENGGVIPKAVVSWVPQDRS